MSKQEPIVDIKALSKSFGRTVALDDVNLKNTFR